MGTLEGKEPWSWGRARERGTRGECTRTFLQIYWLAIREVEFHEFLQPVDLKAQSLKVGMAGIELRGYYIAPGDKRGGA